MNAQEYLERFREQQSKLFIDTPAQPASELDVLREEINQLKREVDALVRFLIQTDVKISE